MTYDSNVGVSVVSGASAVDRAVLNIPLHLSSSPTWPERVRTYGSASEAAADTLLGTEATDAVDAHFAQALHAPQIKIGRIADSAVAQVVTFTIGGTPLEDEVYTITINGIVTEYVAGASPTVTSVHTALKAALTSALASEDVTVGGTDPDITVTADVPGDPFTYSSSVSDPPGGTATGTITEVLTAANAGIGSDLDAILAEDDDWFGLTSEIHSTAADNLARMQACSGWCQANNKIYLGQSSDADVLTDASGNDLETLAAKNNDHTAYLWHHDDDELAAVAEMAYVFEADPDVRSTNWAYKPLSGISLKSPQITSTEQNNVESNDGNLVLSFGGNAVFGMGVTTTGKHIDTIATTEWLRARLREAYIQVLSDFAARNEKIGLNDKDLQVLVNAGQGVLDQGVRANHLNEGSTYISVPLRADMTDADVADRLVRVTAGGTATGAVEKVEVTMTLSLT